MIARSPTVFLVDDDPSVRRALARLLRSAGYAVQAFASAREFLERRLDGDAPACLVLDVRLPGLNGLDLQQALQDEKAALPIVFITGHGDIPMSVKAMKAGAVDFLAKPIKDKDLLKAIDQALARAARERVAREEIDQILQRVDTLTPRELEVLKLVITGMLNKEIAHQLGIVEKTIKVHRARVLEKMGSGSVVELARLAAKVGISPIKS